jgi:DNA-binding transcriptional MerR regulator
MGARSTAESGFLTIREVCAEFRLTQRALRFYEACGLIAPRREGRRRRYAAQDVECIRTVVKLKSLGLSLKEIRELLHSPGDGPYGLNANWCRKVFDRLSAQRAEAEAGLAFLRDFVNCKCGSPERA